MAEAGLQHPDKLIFLYDQPWNRDVGNLPSNVVRVSSLMDVAASLQKGAR